MKMVSSEQNQEIQNQETSLLSSESVMSSSQLSYYELDVVPVRQIDLIDQLEKNLAQLQDLQERLRFSMREIRYLLKM